MADFIITLTIPDAVRAEFLDAYATLYGWVDVATSGTKASFARGIIREQIRSPYRTVKRAALEKAALIAIPAPPDDGIVAI